MCKTLIKTKSNNLQMPCVYQQQFYKVCSNILSTIMCLTKEGLSPSLLLNDKPSHTAMSVEGPPVL